MKITLKKVKINNNQIFWLYKNKQQTFNPKFSFFNKKGKTLPNNKKFILNKNLEK